MFPIPRMTESFIEDVVFSIGWKRYTDIGPLIAGRANADFIAGVSIIELKILEEEGLEKVERQKKIAKLFQDYKEVKGEIDLEIDTIPDGIRPDMEELVSKPIQGVVRKASKQIRHTREDMNLHSSKGILLIVNNGYSYLNADNFERLVKKSAFKDSTQIDFVFCVTVDYHQGDSDSYIFCTSQCHPIKEGGSWEYEEKLRTGIDEKFTDAMTKMMRDQINPSFWGNNLEPVSDILFERDGVRYIRRAPEVPDSRF